MIGDYLGEKNDFNEAVLKAFVELHDFTGEWINHDMTNDDYRFLESITFTNQADFMFQIW